MFQSRVFATDFTFRSVGARSFFLLASSINISALRDESNSLKKTLLKKTRRSNFD